MLKLFSKILGDSNRRTLNDLHAVVEDVNALEPEVQRLSDAELQARTDAFRSRVAAGETLDDILPEAFATVREAARRAIGQRHFDVQLMAGVVRAWPFEGSPADVAAYEALTPDQFAAALREVGGTVGNLFQG